MDIDVPCVSVVNVNDMTCRSKGVRFEFKILRNFEHGLSLSGLSCFYYDF